MVNTITNRTEATLHAEQAFTKSQILFVMVLGFLVVVAMYLHSQSTPTI